MITKIILAALLSLTFMSANADQPIDFFGHNFGLAGNTTRTKYTPTVVTSALTSGKDVVINIPPSQAGCGYSSCVQGQSSLSEYLDEVAAFSRAVRLPFIVGE